MRYRSPFSDDGDGEGDGEEDAEGETDDEVFQPPSGHVGRVVWCLM